MGAVVAGLAETTTAAVVVAGAASAPVAADGAAAAADLAGPAIRPRDTRTQAPAPAAMINNTPSVDSA